MSPLPTTNYTPLKMRWIAVIAAIDFNNQNVESPMFSRRFHLTVPGGSLECALTWIAPDL